MQYADPAVQKLERRYRPIDRSTDRNVIGVTSRIYFSEASHIRPWIATDTFSSGFQQLSNSDRSLRFDNMDRRTSVPELIPRSIFRGGPATSRWKNPAPISGRFCVVR
jgi:hypothetical protein